MTSSWKVNFSKLHKQKLVTLTKVCQRKFTIFLLPANGQKSRAIGNSRLNRISSFFLEWFKILFGSERKTSVEGSKQGRKEIENFNHAIKIEFKIAWSGEKVFKSKLKIKRKNFFLISGKTIGNKNVSCFGELENLFPVFLKTCFLLFPLSPLRTSLEYSKDN